MHDMCGKRGHNYGETCSESKARFGKWGIPDDSGQDHHGELYPQGYCGLIPSGKSYALGGSVMLYLIFGIAVAIYEGVYYARKWMAETRKDEFGIYPDEWVKVRQ